MEPKTIAMEPPHGWGGLKTLQSKIAFQWLYYQDQQLGGNCIKHVRSGGEQFIKVKRGKGKVDGYDTSTKTVYEFHGCEFHGCRKCKPNNRHVKRSNCGGNTSSHRAENSFRTSSGVHRGRDVGVYV